MRKRIACMAAALCMMLAMLPGAAAGSADAGEGKTYYYFYLGAYITDEVNGEYYSQTFSHEEIECMDENGPEAMAIRQDLIRQADAYLQSLLRPGTISENRAVSPPDVKWSYDSYRTETDGDGNEITFRDRHFSGYIIFSADIVPEDTDWISSASVSVSADGLEPGMQIEPPFNHPVAYAADPEAGYSVSGTAWTTGAGPEAAEFSGQVASDTDYWAMVELTAGENAKFSENAEVLANGSAPDAVYRLDEKTLRLYVRFHVGASPVDDPGGVPERKPVITEQPESRTACNGQSVLFRVAAEGKSCTYQWYQKPVGTTWRAIPGETSPELTVTAGARLNGWQYRCKVSNVIGGVYSSAATLTVAQQTKPAITRHPADVTAGKGASASFSVEASGENLTYQWYQRPAGTTWRAIPGETSPELTVTAAAKQNGYQYRCKVTNGAGSVYSSAAALTVVTSKPAITAHPADASAAAGDSVTFLVAASGAGLTYQWYQRPVGTTWRAIPGETSPELTVTATAKQNGYQYRCKVSNSMGGVYSAAAALRVSAE